MKSFRPLYAHPEAATPFSIGVNPPCPGVPVGGPFTSPARAALTLSPENATAHTAATIFLRILISPLLYRRAAFGVWRDNNTPSETCLQTGMRQLRIGYRA